MTRPEPAPNAAPAWRRPWTAVLEVLAPTRCLGCRARSAPPPWCVDCAELVRLAPAG